MLLIYVYFLVYILGTSVKNLSLVYFCNYVLGSYNDGITQTLISIIGGIPMGIGTFRCVAAGKEIRQAECDARWFPHLRHRQRDLLGFPHEHDHHAGRPVH